MANDNGILPDILSILQDKFGERINEFLLPPPVFIAMQGEFLEIDLQSTSLTARFPILESYLNPYGTMQGGMIAAAVDNTLGPLSILIAPANVTRTLELKYSQAVRQDLEYIVVKARLVERKDPKLFFEAIVSSPDGKRLAACKAMHWIIGTA